MENKMDNTQNALNGANTYRITIEVIGQEEEGFKYDGPATVELNGFAVIGQYIDEDGDEAITFLANHINDRTIMNALCVDGHLDRITKHYLAHQLINGFMSKGTADDKQS